MIRKFNDRGVGAGRLIVVWVVVAGAAAAGMMAGEVAHVAKVDES